MFQKPAFGSTNTSTFGSFNAGTSTASPFSGFKPATGGSAFGAPPAFGAAATPQPATGGGLFGSSTTSGGLFGNTAASTSAPAFGGASGGFGFGASTSGGGLFGANTSTGLFGNTQNTSAFGAKPAGFGFGSTSTAAPATGGLFGSTPAAGTGLFGQQNNSMTGGGLFNNTSAFGQQQTATGTGHVKYNPVVGTDVVVKSGTSQNISIKHHCITCMKEYENKSLEELRLEDYTAGRKGATGGVFGGFGAPAADTKPLFGGAASFGQPAATTASSVFGAPALGTSGGFGQTSTFSFGGNAANTTSTTGLFGANKPAFGATPAPSTGLFGATTTQAPTFGTNTSSAFGFGTNTQNQSGGLFGAKPATTGFGAPATSGFGAFGSGGGLFQNKPATTAPAFGAAAPAFGSTLPGGGFGAAAAPTGGLFGANSSFGKPAAAQPAFSFNTQPTLGTGGLGTLGANTQNTFGQQNKPGAPTFGLGGGSMFPQQNTTFRTGLDSGLGGNMFGNNSSLGGLGLNANNSSLNNNSLSGASATNDVHAQILSLAARPYGDEPLFKHLLPESSTTAEDVLKPTNPAAVKAVLDNSGYKVTSPGARLKLHPRAALPTDKKSLFDGLEESDASLEDKLSLKPSRKRLVLRPSNSHGDYQSRDHSLADHSQTRDQTNRSTEEPPPAPQVNGSHSEPKDLPEAPRHEQVERAKRAVNFNDNSADTSADKNGSWLSGSKVSWSEKDKPIEEPTPRLYPSLEKEINTQTSERRASW
ncbi:nuclear pore complex protein Nup98-Nup96-like [Ostrinia furnacalis]|uniref:nuclear pore complex protein Nup98-Nup96-like n=1 Tax=Ostrinia furnacalis TaxID=93504 RepID=UPI0010396FC4|nr:nuclear pore complex protein Nup98-Nup96-like [Ostrinia furnacalis]